MFEIRVICTQNETAQIMHTLERTFLAKSVRPRPTRDGQGVRLYVSAELRPEPNRWPTPEAAYALAPPVVREIGWTAERARTHLHGRAVDREFWLRKAALLDRLALDDEQAGIYADATEVAVNAGRRLLDIDREGPGPFGLGEGPYTPLHPDSAAEPRGYVRQEYAIWVKSHTSR